MEASNRAKEIQTIEGLKSLQYINEHKIFVITRILSSGKTEKQHPFNILTKVEYVMNICNASAAAAGVRLVHLSEAGFPAEVNGDRCRFELVVASMLRYLILHCKRGEEVKFRTKMISPHDGGFLLGFEFVFKDGEKMTSEGLRKALLSKDSTEDLWRDGTYQLRQCAVIISNLGGTIEVPEGECGLIRFELPFAAKDAGQECAVDPKLAIYQCERINQFATRWTDSIIAPVVDTTPVLEHRQRSLPRSSTGEKGSDDCATSKGADHSAAAKEKILAAVRKLHTRGDSTVVVSAATDEDRLRIKNRVKGLHTQLQKVAVRDSPANNTPSDKPTNSQFENGAVENSVAESSNKLEEPKRTFSFEVDQKSGEASEYPQDFEYNLQHTKIASAKARTDPRRRCSQERSGSRYSHWTHANGRRRPRRCRLSTARRTAATTSRTKNRSKTLPIFARLVWVAGRLQRKNVSIAMLNR